jgi:NADH dehydrogenase
VNLVGIMTETRRQSFTAVHADGARAVADIAAAEGVTRLAHVSALGVAPDSQSRYYRTKAEGEAAVRAEFPTAIIVRPSVQFGVGDSFFNRFAGMARLSPVLPIVGPNTRFQPVYAGDVAEVIARAVDGDVGAGIYELGGPEVLTFRETMQLMLATIERRRIIAALPFGVARIVAPIAQLVPGKPLTPDQVRQLRYDSVVSTEADAAGRTLAGLGMRPTTLAAILPTYLSRFRVRGEFSVPHDAAG